MSFCLPLKAHRPGSNVEYVPSSSPVSMVCDGIRISSSDTKVGPRIYPSPILHSKLKVRYPRNLGSFQKATYRTPSTSPPFHARSCTGTKSTVRKCCLWLYAFNGEVVSPNVNFVRPSSFTDQHDFPMTISNFNLRCSGFGHQIDQYI